MLSIIRNLAERPFRIAACLRTSERCAIQVERFDDETIDRVVAVVNAHTILLSDWDTAVRLEALLNHKPLESVTATSRRAAFERMIDQELLGAEPFAEVDLWRGSAHRADP